MLKHLSFIALSLLACTAMDQTKATNMPEEPAEIIRKYNFTQSEPLPFTTEGLSVPEEGFRWTSGKQATFQAPVAEGDVRIQRVIFKDVSALAKPDYPQTLDIFVQDQPAGTQIVFNGDAKQDVTVDIPATITGNLTIKFVMDKACLPNVFDPSNTDQRELALQLRGLDVYMKKTAAGRGCVLF